MPWLVKEAQDEKLIVINLIQNFVLILEAAVNSTFIQRGRKATTFSSIFKQDLWQMNGGLEQQAKAAPLSFFA